MKPFESCVITLIILLLMIEKTIITSIQIIVSYLWLRLFFLFSFLLMISVISLIILYELTIALITRMINSIYSIIQITLFFPVNEIFH